MSQWVKLCGVAEAPEEGKLVAVEVEGIAICLAKVGGELSAIDNWCPHRRAPLAEGWIEGEAVVCPWHSWSFNVKTGVAVYPEKEKVEVFPTKVEGEEILIDLA